MKLTYKAMFSIAWAATKTNLLASVSYPGVQAWLSEGKTLLIDIREDEEHARRALPGAISMPLSRFPRRLAVEATIERVVFTCQTGRRTTRASHRLAASVEVPSFALAGGLDRWAAATEYLLLSNRTRQVLETEAGAAWKPSKRPA